MKISDILKSEKISLSFEVFPPKKDGEFEAAFAEALTCKTPFVIDCIIDCDDKVWPMVAPGAPINEAFDEKDLLNKQK